MSLAQPGDPPRVPPVQQYEEFVEADMYQQLMAVAAPNEADVDVHHVLHAIVIFFLVFVLDDYSNFLWTFPLSKKIQVFSTFLSFRAFIHT